jgi:hypothetical protein
LQPKLWIAAGLVVAFLSGLMANGIYVATTRAFNPAQEFIESERNGTASVALTRTHFVQPELVYVSNPAPISRPVYETEKKRTWQKEALIIGGSAGAGAAIGAVAGGGKEPASAHYLAALPGLFTIWQPATSESDYDS